MRYAARRLLHQPGIAAAAITTIGLGVGLTTAVYSIAAAVLFRPLPFAEPDRLVAIWRTAPEVDFIPVPIPEFADLQTRSTSLEDVAGFLTDGRTVIAPGVTEWADVFSVTPNLFDLLGVRAVVGRTSADPERQTEPDRVAILTEGFWRRVFGGDPAIVGKRIRLAGRGAAGADDSYEVLGIVPWSVDLSYRRPLRVDVFIPHVLSPEERSDERRRVPGLLTFGRLNADVSAAQAETDVRALMTQLRDEHPTMTLPGADARVVPLHEELVGQTRPAVVLLGWGSAVVLLVACVNVANLLLVSGVRRRREFVIRRALGCSGPRLFRQLLAEHLPLVLLGGATGILVTVGTMPLVERLIPPSLPRGDLIRIDLGVLAFAATATAAAGLLSGCLPAWVATRPQLANALRAAGSVSLTGRRVTAGLVMGETALVLVLLAGAGLLTSSLSRIGALELGFDPSDVVIMQIELPRRLANTERAPVFERDLLRLVRNLPGVERAATSDQLPFASGSLATVSLVKEDLQQPSLVSAVDPDYFSVLGVPLRRGRMLGSTDRGKADVAVVNEALARLFPEGRALGERIRVARQWREVVGVVGDTTELGQIYGSVIRRSGALARLTLPSAFVPSGTASTPFRFFLVLRSVLTPADLDSVVRRQISDIDSEVSIRRTSTLEARIDAAGAGVRFQMLLAWVFAGVSLILATVGLHGVLAHAVGQRTSEIGLRMSLGASPGRVRWLIARRAMGMVACGLAVGLAVVVVGGRAMRSFLFEVSPLDPGTLAAAVGVLLAGAAVGAHLPIRRATRIDPAVALRSE